MIVELRVYHCVPGRMPAVHQRFVNTALDFFKKYGIQQIGFWTNLTGTDHQALTYLLKWESMAERETKWNAFQADAQWRAKHAESEAQGPLIARIENHFMEPTSYSALR
jgi:heme-degrading monooxygenase HmoA